MPDKLTAKQASFCRYYTDSSNRATFNNGRESARAANYKGNDNTLTVMASENLTKPNIKDAISSIQADKQARTAYNYDISLQMKRDLLANVEKQAVKGDKQANALQATILRDMDTIAGLNKNRFVDETEHTRELNEAEKAKADEIAAYSLRQSLRIQPKTHQDGAG